MAKRKQNISVVSTIIGAIVIGLILGAIMFNPPGEPVGLPDVSFEGEYDDDWGKLSRPIQRGHVTHILITWDGQGRAQPKESRNQEEARELIEQLWHRYRNEPTESNWRDLQERYNEDGAPHNEYDVVQGSRNLDPDFTETGLNTEVGHARIVESQFGYHLIRRER
jgi:hypothetical protein